MQEVKYLVQIKDISYTSSNCSLFDANCTSASKNKQHLDITIDIFVI